MKKAAMLGLALVAVIAPATSIAQTGSGTSGLAIKIGQFFPIANEPRNVEGKQWFTIGLDYELAGLGMRQMPDGNIGRFVGSLDYYGDGSYSNVAAMVNWVGTQDKFFYRLGGGVGFVRTPKIGGGTVTNNEFVYQFGVGYDFGYNNQAFFAEARFLGSVEDRLNGYAITIGYRF
ncbi:MAG: hypothetical protein KF812_12385 [Fimbriimonadaceae bacterium]|nr:hypothetical protein [Fimbriimonadaceae bacterium]